MDVLRRRCSLLILAVIVLGALVLPDRPAPVEAAGTTVPFYPKSPQAPTLLYVIPSSSMSPGERSMIATLQGLLAKTRPEIYVDEGGQSTVWLNHMKSRNGVTTSNVTGAWALINQFKSRFASQYILYRTGDSSINVANSLAGPRGAVIVEQGMEATAIANGLTRILDVRGLDEAWLRTNHWASLRHDLVFEQKETLDYHLRDYATMTNAMIFYDGNTAWRQSLMSAMDPDATVMGWGDPGTGESTFIRVGSQAGNTTVPADFAGNLSVHAAIKQTSLTQSTHVEPAAETGVHYVSFLITDGDNLQWMLSGINVSNWWGSAQRGTFNLGWGMPPGMIDAAPAPMSWFYSNSANGTYKDNFVAGPSGDGYFYPSLYPPADLDLQIGRLNTQMGRSDLRVAQVIDFNNMNNLVLWNKYTLMPNVQGLIFLDYDNYALGAGRVNWSNGKPIVAPRYNMANAFDDASLPGLINALPRTPTSADGYTLIIVTCWSRTLDNIRSVINGFGSHVRVVTPETMFKLMTRNIPHPGGTTSSATGFGFISGAEGWAGVTSGKSWDAARWDGATGNPAGALVLDGSDGGVADSEANAIFSQRIALPASVTDLTFQTRSSDATHGGRLRVRVQDGASGTTLRDWTLVRSASWLNNTVNLRPYAGKTVTLMFEQNDSGAGAGEMIYLDNIAIKTATSSPNLALGRPATASGTCNATTEGAPMAVDGSTTTKWCDNSSASKWLQVDLGSSQSIGSFTVRHAGAGGENAAWNTSAFNIQTSADGATWSPAVSVSGNTANITTHSIAARSARYVRLNVTTPTGNGDPAARIFELEVYGAAGPTPTPAGPTATRTATSAGPTATRTPTRTATRTPTVSATTNLALGRPATASGTCNATTEGAPMAVDGSTTTKWCSGGASKWLQVDLGSSMSVGRFTLTHAGGESAGYITRGYTIQTSTDGATWTTVVTVTANTANDTSHTITARGARYVRLNVTQAEQTTNNAARIYELRVFAL